MIYISNCAEDGWEFRLRISVRLSERPLRRPYGTPESICRNRLPHASTPRNKDRFLGTPVKRGANEHCAYGACIKTPRPPPSHLHHFHFFLLRQLFHAADLAVGHLLHFFEGALLIVLEEVQKMTDGEIRRMEELSQKKEVEVMQV